MPSLVLALPSIRVTQTRFTGGIKFYDNGTMYRDNGGGPRYVGPPHPEIDANWEALVGTRYLAFTHDQKSSFQVNMDRDSNDGLYRAGPDAFHSLHCVNKLRQTLDAYIYDIPDKVDESKGNVLHIEHCLDFLRQLVACSSDLTPIPLIYSKGAGQAVPDFEQLHTCRNFEAIHDWAMKQNEDALKSVEGTGVGKSLIP
jgi:Mycotoxin biosynthesis protein UstYa